MISVVTLEAPRSEPYKKESESCDGPWFADDPIGFPGVHQGDGSMDVRELSPMRVAPPRLTIEF